MSEAEAILWFAVTALFGGGVCYAVRGLLGESVRIRKKGAAKPSRSHRVSWSLVLLGCVLFLLSAVSIWGAFEVRRWYAWQGGFNDTRLTVAVSAGLLMPCFVLIGIGIIGDRSKGRLRCPACWYDMSAGGAQCPECGRAISQEAELRRSRRRRWPFVLAAFFIAAGIFSWTHLGRIVRAGPLGAVPTPILAAGWRWLPEKSVIDLTVGGSLIERIEAEDSDPIGLWESTGRALADPGSFETLMRAGMLRQALLEQRFRTEQVTEVESLNLSEKGQLALGAFVLSAKPQTPSEQSVLDSLAWGWYGVTARLTGPQQTAVLEEVARGGDAPGSSLILVVGSVNLVGPDDSLDFDAEKAIDALEGHSFPVGDRRSQLLAIVVGAALQHEPGLLDRVHASTDHADARVRLLSLRSLLASRRDWNQPIPVRVRAALGRALRDPDADVRTLAAQALLNSPATDSETVSEIIAVLRSSAPGREGLIPHAYTGHQLPLELEEAVVDAIADADPVVASHAAEYVRLRLALGDERVATLAERAQALLNAGALRGSNTESERNALECSILFAQEAAASPPPP